MNKQLSPFLTRDHVHALGPSPRAVGSPAARVNKLILCVARTAAACQSERRLPLVPLAKGSGEKLERY